MPICKKCLKRKAIDKFYIIRSGQRYFRQGHCKKCHYEYQKKYRPNKEKAKQITKNYLLKRNTELKQSTNCNITYPVVLTYGFDNVLAVYKRDGNKCKYCGETKRKLVLHHEDFMGKSKTRTPNNNPNNLILLCDRCHFKAHSKKFAPQNQYHANV
jgi:hypothetical protein